MRYTAFILIGLLLPVQLFADEATVKRIEQEIALLAKKLLSVTGKESYTIDKKGKSVTFIGGCFEARDGGIQLTCVTPGLDVQNKGMKSGDLITAINGISFDNNSKENNQLKFSKLTKNIKPKDVFKMTYLDENKQLIQVDVVVSEIVFPSFNLTVTVP